MRTNDEATQGNYLVKLITESYIVQESMIMKRVDTPHPTFPDKLYATLCF